MADGIEASELSKIAKLNGDFRRNYGKLLGAFLYLRSIGAARRTSSWGSLIAALSRLHWRGWEGRFGRGSLPKSFPIGQQRADLNNPQELRHEFHRFTSDHRRDPGFRPRHRR
ncbi:hypothetical protein [Bradyrhizobium sp. STM 3561]|uniref:hypothetical protein n=1 Tax=Bradyrhizobium sp. STM 3561 TaxID=578923 RepID=UPI00388DFCC9